MNLKQIIVRFPKKKMKRHIGPTTLNQRFSYLFSAFSSTRLKTTNIILALFSPQ